ncbi:TPA: hypothetical protein L6A21_32615 [Pseudomonas aeruginosa]|nr:hypothetical protein [Pseudomonas aeruginosa]
MISSWSTCHKILHILMFITSFEEQNITYRSCSNLRIHLCLSSGSDRWSVSECASLGERLADLRQRYPIH